MCASLLALSLGAAGCGAAGPRAGGPIGAAAADSVTVQALIDHREAGVTAPEFILQRPLNAPVRPPIPASSAVPLADSDHPLVLVVLVQGDEPRSGTPRELAGVGERAGQGGVELVAGLRAAHEILAAAGQGRKVLVVLGDGAAPGDVLAPVSGVARELRALGVEVFSIHHAGEAPADPSGRMAMRVLGYSGHHAAASRDQIPAFAAAIADRIAAGYLVSFQVPAAEVAEPMTITVMVRGTAYRAAPIGRGFAAAPPVDQLPADEPPASEPPPGDEPPPADEPPAGDEL